MQEDVVWRSKLDHRYKVKVVRIAPYHGELSISEESEGDQVLHKEDVALMYNALFGPDVDVCPDETRLVMVLKVLITQDGDLMALSEEGPFLICVPDGAGGETKELMPDGVEYGSIQQFPVKLGIECVRSDREEFLACRLEEADRPLNQRNPGNRSRPHDCWIYRAEQGGFLRYA